MDRRSAAPGRRGGAIDLRIDHVYLVSCKYESDILANASPGRLFDGLLATQGGWDRGDWYDAVAPEQLAALYVACLAATGLTGYPPLPVGLQPRPARYVAPGPVRPRLSRRRLAERLRRPVPGGERGVGSAVDGSDGGVGGGLAEGMLRRLLRIGSAPYFVLGNDRRTGAPARYRIASPWTGGPCSNWRSSP